METSDCVLDGHVQGGSLQPVYLDKALEANSYVEGGHGAAVKVHEVLLTTHVVCKGIKIHT